MGPANDRWIDGNECNSEGKTLATIAVLVAEVDQRQAFSENRRTVDMLASQQISRWGRPPSRRCDALLSLPA